MAQQQEQSFAIEKAAPAHLQETSAASRAATATALVQARCVMAIQRPRDWDTVRTKLLRECQRPGFAKAGVYRKPVGGGKTVNGSSVRFAEAAMRYAGNIDVKNEVVHEDEASVTVQVSVLDLETNAGSESSVRVQKTVERASSIGRTVLGKRVNSDGKPVFIVVATEEELVMKINSQVSKARRNLIVQFIPGDITEECKIECQRVFADRTAEDPDAARKQMYDDFAEYDVTPAQIKAHLGHGNPPTVKELSMLRELHSALATGETTWAAITEDQTSDAERKRNEALKAATESAGTATVAVPVVAPVAKNPPSAPANDQPKPRGDVEDALIRIGNCPPEEVEYLRSELRTYEWNRAEISKIAAQFDRVTISSKAPLREPGQEG